MAQTRELERGSLLSMSLSDSESCNSSDMERSTSGGRGLKKLVVAGVGALALLAVGAYASKSYGVTSKVDMQHAVSLVAPPAVGMAMPPVAQPALQPAVAQQAVPQQTRHYVAKPAENLADGNPCDTTEEPFEGLCYTKCSTLMQNPAATRIDAFSCCPKVSCDITDVFNLQTASMIPCDGYDVSNTDGVGTSCPHKFGVCLENEEQFLGVCYEKCAILTNGKSPVRSGPASCCQEQTVLPGEGVASDLDCLNPFEEDMNSKYDVGGGKGDGDPSTESAPHYPDESMTELKPAQTTR